MPAGFDDATTGSDATDSGDPRIDAASVIADVRRIVLEPCRACGQPLCGHDGVLTLVLGYKNSPLCAGCLTQAMREPRRTLLLRVGQYLARRDCFLAGWTWANAEEGVGDADPPPCIAAPGCTPMLAGVPPAARPATDSDSDPASRPDPMPSAPEPDAVWQAGDMSCGDLVLELRLRLRAMRPGQVLQVVATDPGAPQDIPAWCGLTGHRLRSAIPPDYRIERKPD